MLFWNSTTHLLCPEQQPNSNRQPYDYAATPITSEPSVVSVKSNPIQSNPMCSELLTGAGNLLCPHTNRTCTYKLLDFQFQLSRHICTIVNKVHSSASLLLKCFHSRERTALLKAFVIYVRSLIEYASPVWSPSTITNTVAKIESIRRLFTKRPPGLKKPSIH